MSSLFKRDIATLKGVGEKRGVLYRRLGAPTVGDLLRLYPREYEDWSQILPIAQAEPGELVVISATVAVSPQEQRLKGGKLLYKVLVTDGESDLTLTFFNNKYIPSLLKQGELYLFRGKVSGGYRRKEMAAPAFLPGNRQPALLPVYPATQGLSSRLISNAMALALKLLPPEMQDPLPSPLRQEHKLCHLSYALENIHFPKGEEELTTAKRRLVFEEFLLLQLGMLEIRQGRKEANLHPMPKAFPTGFTQLLPFSLTGAQHRAIAQAFEDMGGENPMNRLIQGDVGSGKTAVAAALCYGVAKEGMQAALMAPTEILATQHYASLAPLLAPAGITCALLTGGVKGAKRKALAASLAQGETQLVIGTHALISDYVEFQNLGLVITDEQHRFGVNQRSKLAKKGASPHLLVMSATPIPRTLALMIYGDLDISILDELPPGRQKIETYLISSEKRHRAFGFVQQHLEQGRQGYLICPLIDQDESELASVQTYFDTVKTAFPQATVAMLHGKMKGGEKERVMGAFSQGEIQLLVATTVVEVGVDVPNAVIMLIENAERYGLSQLHQLRGRIGRGVHKSTCILVTDARNEETITRLKLFRNTSDGFQIADADLRLRGPGDFFGQRQHGLPQLKIADMTSDLEPLRAAQQCAKDIFNHALLDTPPYHSLRAEMRLLFHKAGDGVVL